MTDAFQFAGGSVPGRDHLTAVKNGHDAYCLRTAEDVSVAVVCDGCGSGLHSEVGAKIGARIVARVAQEMHEIAPDSGPEEFWEAVRLDSLRHLAAVRHAMGVDTVQALNDYLLFTVVAALVTRTRTDVVAIGDGVAVANGERLPLGPFEGNAPPYLSYGLMPASRHGLVPDSLRFTLLKSMPTEELQSLLIGTDGIEPLFSEGKVFPANGEPIGAIDRLWTEDRFFRNPDMVRRHLAKANATRGALHGIFADDATLAVGRRKP